MLPITYISIGLVILHFLLDTTVLNEDVSGSEIPLGNTFIIFMILGLVLSSVLMIYIFTKMSDKGIRYLYAVVFTFSHLYLVMELIFQILNKFSDNNILSALIFSFILLVSTYLLVKFFIIYATGKFSINIRNYGIILTSILMGRLMSIQLDLEAIIFFAILLSVYDIYSVFKGPLSKIIGKPQKVEAPINIDAESFRYQIKQVFKKGTPVLVLRNNTLLGVGDPLFYSILLYQALTLWNFAGMALIVFSLTIGAILTNYLLTKISPLPALPIPVGLSLMAYLILSLTV
jgi:hypothetical protein